MNNSNIELSNFVAGFWRLKDWGMSAQQLLAYVTQCTEWGITSMDHAMIYGSEQPFGKALALQPALRSKLEIVTKFGIRFSGFGDLGAKHTAYYDNSASAMIQSLENSLKQLNTDYVDVLLVHRPDYLMNAEALAKQMEALKKAGKVLQFGVSNFTVDQFELLQSFLDFPLVTNQVELSPYHTQDLNSGVLEQCCRYQIKPMLWSCLGAGSIVNPVDEKGRRLLTALNEVAEEVGADCPEQVVYAWLNCLPSQPRILLGSSKIKRVKTAIDSLHLNINKEQWYKILEASNGCRVP